MDFVVATHNQNKIEEFRRILSLLGHSITVAQLNEVEETGTTFMENARLKAVAACKQTGLPCIADDSGLCIDALGGAPGVYSARFDVPGRRKQKVLQLLSGLEPEQRGAYFESAICCAFPSGDVIQSQGRCFGRIAQSCRGNDGFGYDPLFEVDGRTYAEMTAAQKDEISHRGKALRDFAVELSEYLTLHSSGIDETGYDPAKWDFSCIGPGDFAGCLLCTDIDGSLVSTGGIVPRANVEAIQAFVRAGGLFTVSTGRHANYVNSTIGRVLPINAPMITFGGALCEDGKTGKIYYDCTMKCDVAALLQFVFENARGLIAIRVHDREKTVGVTAENYTEYLGWVRSTPIYKFLMVFDEEENALQMRKVLDGSIYSESCDFCRSWPVGLEILDRYATKGEAALHLKKSLDAKLLVCVGDYENDLSMLRDADIAAAVENAADCAKQAAGNVVAKNTEGALADVILKLKNNRLLPHNGSRP